jgi:O-antigen/teichoic acid export membrane protein
VPPPSSPDPASTQPGTPSPATTTQAFSERVVVLFVTQVVTAGIGIGIGFFLARALGPSGKGEFYLLTLLPTTIMVLLQLGLNQAFGFYAGRGQTGRLTSKTFVLAGLLGGLALVGLAIVLPTVGRSLVQDLDPTALVIVLVALPMVVNATFTGAIVVGRQAVRPYAAINIATTLTYATMLFVIVVIFRFGVVGAVSAFLIATIVQTSGFAIAAARVGGADPGAERVGYRALFRYGLPYYPGSLTNFFAARADVYMLALLLAEPTAPLGFYSMSVSMAELVFYFPNAVSTLFFPHVAGAAREDADRQVPQVSRVTLLLTAGVALLLVPVASVMIPLLIPAFTPALPALFILLPGVVSLSVAKVLTGYITGLGMTGLTSVVNIGAFALNVAINLVLIPAFGILGASAASLISYTASSITLTVIASRLAHVPSLDFWIPRSSDVRLIIATISAVAGRFRRRG